MDCSQLRVAAVQLHSGPDPEDNWDRIVYWVEAAARDGAQLVVLPEHCLRIAPELFQPLDWDTWGPRFSELARACQIHLVAGSVLLPAGRYVRNTCVVLDSEGVELARYAKIHLFDAIVAGADAYRESDHVQAGEITVVVRMPFGPMGVAICYDLRFPELFRRLMEDGAPRVLVLPSDFTLETGRDHWRPLLCARAIENQAFVIAADQWGAKFGTRRSYGHSAIVDPWGTVQAEAPDGEGIVVATLDFQRQDQLRADMPCLLHRRL